MRKQKTRSPATYYDAYFLSHCSEVKAITWLSQRTLEIWNNRPVTPDDSHLLEYILLRRNSARIDLALAKHGRSQTILTRLYYRSKTSIKVVACGNVSLFFGETHKNNQFRSGLAAGMDLLREILFRGPLSELRSLCENNHLPHDIYSFFIDSLGPKVVMTPIYGEDYVNEDHYLYILNFLSKNKYVIDSKKNIPRQYFRWQFGPDFGNCPDGFFNKVWELVETAPTTFKWARVLLKLIDDIYIPHKGIIDVNKCLSRWQPPGEEYLQDGEIINHKIVYESIRYTIASAFITPSVEMLNQKDRALRFAFYLSFDPMDKNFRNLNWQDLFDLDEDYVLYFMWRNMNIWKSKIGREKMRLLIRHATAFEKGDRFWSWRKSYFDKIETLESLHPDWFEDENGKSLSQRMLLGDVAI